MLRPGPHNLITDVPGITVGQATDERAATGVTVIACDGAWVAAADVRGGGPATREIDVLGLENLVGRVHAISLSGGSVFGLAAADGVVAALSQRGEGLTLGPGLPPIPIVPAACLFDFGHEGDKAWGDAPPYRALGLAAANSLSTEMALGRVGAGRGARAGSRPGGIGSASLALSETLTIGALAAVNPVGSVYEADGKSFYAWPFELDGEFGGARPDAPLPPEDPFPQHSRIGGGWRSQPGAATTLCVIAVSAELTGPECKRVAMMAQDGLARAIRPAHTPFDGDVVFCLASGAALPSGPERQVHVARIGAAAADVLARAIARGVHAAQDG